MTELNKTRREAHGMSERAWAVYMDQGRRSADAVAEVIRISVAEELRRLAAANPGPFTNGYLLSRADELDPDGAE